MNGQTVLVTGASSGIGLELARCFAAEGCRLILLARRGAALQTLAHELRDAHRIEAEVLLADLSLPGVPRDILSRLQTNGTHVDVLVNNAGMATHGLFVHTSLERQLEMVQVNVPSLMHLTRLLLPGMVERGRGAILNVASTAAFQPGPIMTVYYATKAFVLSFSEGLAEELVGSGVTVTALCPGPTLTPFPEVSQVPASRFFQRTAMSARAVANYGHHAFRRGRVIAIPGFPTRLVALLIRWAPRKLVRKVTKRLNLGGHL
jgi:short-subunit dehydrogenase